MATCSAPATKRSQSTLRATPATPTERRESTPRDTAADTDRLAKQFRIVAPFHRRAERVEVSMEDRRRSARNDSRDRTHVRTIHTAASSQRTSGISALRNGGSSRLTSGRPAVGWVCPCNLGRLMTSTRHQQVENVADAQSIGRPIVLSGSIEQAAMMAPPLQSANRRNDVN